MDKELIENYTLFIFKHAPNGNPSGSAGSADSESAAMKVCISFLLCNLCVIRPLLTMFTLWGSYVVDTVGGIFSASLFD